MLFRERGLRDRGFLDPHPRPGGSELEIWVLDIRWWVQEGTLGASFSSPALALPSGGLRAPVLVGS